MDFIDEFILEYKHNPCLWKADSAHFKNRTKRQEAYMKLIEVASKHGEHYNVERTKQKINNLRCAFRHQLKKYTESKNKGESEELYCPKRKYFESLLFLKDEEIAEKIKKSDSISSAPEEKVEYNNIPNITVVYEKNPETPNIISVQNLNEECENNNGNIVQSNLVDAIINTALVNSKDEPLRSRDIELRSLNNSSIIEYEEVNAEEVNAEEVSPVHKECITEYEKETCGYSLRKPARRKRQRSVSESSRESDINSTKLLKVDVSGNDFEKLLSIACRNTRRSEDDCFTNFGKLVEHKLRLMDPAQATLAEKIITDVLFQGQMKILNLSSVNRIGSFECIETVSETRTEK